MNYLTNYYKNLSEKLQYQVNSLNNQHQMLSEALSSYGSYGRNTVDGGVVQQPFSGQQLGQMLGSGNVHGAQNYVNSFSGEYNGGSPATYRMAPSAGYGRGRGSASMDDSQGGFLPGDYNGDGRVDGADLGQALGSGQNANSVINSWSAGGGNPSGGLVNRSRAMNSGRGRGGLVGGGADNGMFPYSPYSAAGGAAAGGAADDGAFGGGQGGYDGGVLGDLLGRGDMNAVNRYLSQFVGKPNNYGTSSRKRKGY
jgi:hypothetical protein